MTDDKQRVAYHEAAHAVVALLERVKVYSATIIPSDEAEGVTRHHNLLYGRGVEWDASHPNRIRMERLVRMALAGPVADELRGVHDERTVIGPTDDEHCAAELVGYFTGNTEETEAYLKLLWIQTRALLKRDPIWSQVTAVAEALLAHKTLSAKEIRGIARSVLRARLEAGTRGLVE
jgi:hypothetical protein